MPALIDLTGHRFNSWTVKKRGDNAGTATRWVCRCDCGSERLVRAGHLKNGASTSCGCKRRGPIKHGAAIGGHHQFSPTYRSWRSMRSRILDPKHKDYHYYGGRGIRICERWDDFTAFLADMGERPTGKSLDRINSNGDYEPANCRWATREQQVANLPQNQKDYRHKRSRT